MQCAALWEIGQKIILASTKNGVIAHILNWLHSDFLRTGAENMGKSKGGPVETERHISGDVHIL